MDELEEVMKFTNTFRGNYAKYGVFIYSTEGFTGNSVLWSKDWKNLAREISDKSGRPLVWVQGYEDNWYIELKQRKYMRCIMSIFFLADGNPGCRLWSDKTNYYVRCNRAFLDIWLGHLLTEECQRALTTPRKQKTKIKDAHNANISNAA